MTALAPQSVLILGTGLAGLALAYDLARRGVRVTLLDHPVWRQDLPARRSDAAAILLGCQYETLRLVQTVTHDAPPLSETILPLKWRLPDGRMVAYHYFALPRILQWVPSLFTFGSLAWHERWHLFSYVERLWEGSASLPSDLDSRVAGNWLASIGQSQTAQDQVWNPLALWLTGNEISRLSAAVFAQTLGTVFLNRASDARLTSLQGSLDECLLAPLRVALEDLGVTVLQQSDFPQIQFERNTVGAVRLGDGTLLKADWYIATLSPRQLLALLPEWLLTRFAYFAQIAELTVVPAIIVQTICRTEYRAPQFLLLSGQPFHQLTTTVRGSHEVRYQLVAIGNRSLADLSDTQLIDLGGTVLRTLLPHAATDEIRASDVYREDHAALSLGPGAAIHRPIPQSPLPNFLVAGAWTDTGWPANAESALISARRCREIIIGPDV